MGKWKIVEIVLSAISALVSAAKAVMKFIDQIGKLKKEPAKNTATA
jgi:hypothetical protein